MATEITKGVEQVSVGKEEISLARAGQLVSKLASKDMCVLHIASVAVIFAVSTLANADSCFVGLVRYQFIWSRVTQSLNSCAAVR